MIFAEFLCTGIVDSSIELGAAHVRLNDIYITLS